MSARVIQVIEVQESRGSGTEAFPFRQVTAYYTLEGTRLAEYDPCDTPVWARLGFREPEKEFRP